MNRRVVVAWFAFAIAEISVSAWARDLASCPIEQSVGKIRKIAGDVGVVHLFRDKPGNVDAMHPDSKPEQIEVPVAKDTCVWFGDTLKVGEGATLTIETTQGIRHFGGEYDPTWVVPGTQGHASVEWSELLNGLYQDVMGAPRLLASNTMGRASDTCPPSVSGSPLAPLDRLRVTDQQIGADLRVIVAAWAPTEPRSVRAMLLREDRSPIVQGSTCLNSHLLLPLPLGALHPGSRLTLEISDDRNSKLRYSILVVESSTLSRPSVQVEGGWLLGAWRLAKGMPGTRLDSISRLVLASPDALGAQRILEAVWTDTQF